MTAIVLQLAYLGAIGFCFCSLGWLMLRAEKNHTTKALVICQILIIIWCLPQLFMIFAHSRAMKYVLYGISYMGISFIGPGWLMFCFLYCGLKINSRAKAVMFAIACADYGMFWTNDLHHLFYRSFEMSQVVYGPVFYFHMVYSYTCVIWGIAAVLHNLRKDHTQKRRVAGMILAAAAIPLLFNMLYLSGTVKAEFDLTPPVFALSSFLMLLALFRYDLLDVNVAASGQIFASMGEGVIIWNARGKVTCCNAAACRYVEVKNGDDYETVIRRLCQSGGVEFDSFNRGFCDKGTDSPLFHLPEGKKLRIHQYHIYDRKGRETAGVLLMTDVGEYYELLRQSRELAVSEQRLAIAQERNRIAQEVHDTTGHTLTMIQSLVKLIRIHYEDQEKRGMTVDSEIQEYLTQAQELAGNGIRELRWSIHHMKTGRADELVTQSVCQLAASVKELEIEVEIQGEDGPRYSYLSRTVYQCLREAVTNCLKYSQAVHMDVIVKFAENSLSVYIFDNGQGCAAIEEHNGLSGIRRRISEAGGQVRFLSAAGEGFQIFFELPADNQNADNQKVMGV